MKEKINGVKEIYLYLKIIEPTLTQLYDKDRLRQIKAIIGRDKGKIIITKDCLIKKLASIFGIKCRDYQRTLSDAKRIFAFRDALYYLSKRKIPVFFFNRIGKKKGFAYSTHAMERMEKGKSFPQMYKDIEGNASDFMELFGNKYSVEYVDEMGKIPQVVKIGNLYRHEEAHGKYVNVVNGLRITKNQPEKATRKLHIYGRCGVFGYAVEDGENIPSVLQNILINEGYSDIKVVNHGLWGGEDCMLDNNFFFEVQDFKEGDIVLFYRYRFEERINELLERYGMWYKDITDEWHDYSDAKWCFYDKPGHMNKNGYRNVAEIIVKNMISKQFMAKEVDYASLPTVGVSELHDYIEKNENVDFETNINKYLAGLEEVANKAKGKNNGAIVMNCNPFTYGHRYLIEYAAERVDYLFIFVVEENKSFFEYSDRYRMVCEGTKDILNVIVANSGKFIISSYTFPEYFMKDYVKEKDFDVSNDINIFCKYIAPKLSIRKRFVGEEPLDPVTNNYNETMKRILPQYDMELVEIKRKMIDETKVINATEVRRMLVDNNLDNLVRYVPDTTYRILMEKYVERTLDE